MQMKSLGEVTFDIINSIHDTMPSVDTKTGTFTRDVFIDPISNEISALYEQAKLVELSQSVLTAVGSDLDNLAANFFIKRKGATVSTGSIRFYFDMNVVENNTNQTLSILAGTTVSTQGTSGTPAVQFTTTSDVVIVANSGQNYSYDSNTQQYYVDIPAWSALPGAINNVAPNTIVLAVSALDPAISSITNPYPFQNGSDAESDQSLALRISLALLGANIGTKDGYLSYTLKQNGVMDALIVGAGDPLMLRDDGKGGDVDIYIRGQNPTTMTMQFVSDVYYVTGTGEYTQEGPYSNIVFEYQPLIMSTANSSLNQTALTLLSLDVSSLIGKGTNYTTTYKNAANYSLEPGDNMYYIDYQWDFSLLNQTQNQPQNTKISSVFPAGMQVYIQYTYLTAIGESTPSPEQTITMDGSNSYIQVNVGVLPPGAIGFNVYVSAGTGQNASSASGQETLLGSSQYGASTYTITNLPSNQNVALPPTGNQSGIQAPSAKPILQMIPNSTSNNNGMNSATINSTIDTQALDRTLYFNTNGVGSWGSSQVGLQAISYLDYINLSEKLVNVQGISDLEYDVNWANLVWYNVNQYDPTTSSTYAMVNGAKYFFDNDFNIAVGPDGLVYALQVTNGTYNPSPYGTLTPTASNRFFIVKNGSWYERRYYQPDFIVVHDISPTGHGTLEKGTKDSIEWLSNASQKPQIGEVLTIQYNINQLVEDLQTSIEAKRVLTANVMIKQATRVGINIYIEAAPYSGYGASTVQQNIISRITNYANNLSPLGGQISKLDLIYITKGTDGVQSMSTTNLKLSRTLNSDLQIDGVDQYTIQLQPYEYMEIDNIYVLMKASGYVFNNV